MTVRVNPALFCVVIAAGGLLCRSGAETLSPAPSQITVAADGSGDFRTVQAAIDSLPPNSPQPAVIRIRPGRYKERIRLGPLHPHVTLAGDGPGAAKNTILTYDLSARSLGPDGKPVGTSGSASVELQADDFTAVDLTFENSAGPGKVAGQAVAVKVTGDRCLFRRCRFIGWQDTLYASASTMRPASDAPAAPPATTAPRPTNPPASGGAPNGSMPGANRMCRQYYQDCFITGDVDYIFGSARAVFERCTIRSRAPGAITAHARTDPDQPGGYVFRNCDLTADPSVPPGSVTLGRPWRPYARVVFLSSRMGPHINPKGWDNWRDPSREKTAFYAEADCTGPGANRGERVPWARTLSAAEKAEFETNRFLSGADNWKQ
ncbi:MAG: pectinesterase family protein [Armatimonadota bacterium]